MPRELILYIAMSLDGYIAGEDDNIDFLSVVDKPGEDFGFSSFVKDVDTLIWGRKTYDKVLTLGVSFPYYGLKCYVLSKTRSGNDGNVEYYNGSPGDLVRQLKSAEGKHIYCDGGGEVVYELLREKLIDRMIVSVIPHLLGQGKRLFHDNRPEQYLEFIRSITYPTGLVQLWYKNKN